MQEAHGDEDQIGRQHALGAGLAGEGAVLAGGHRDDLQAGDVTVFIGHEAFGGGRVVDGDLGLLLFGAFEVHRVGRVDVLATLFHGGSLLVGAGEGRPRAVVWA